MLNVLAEVGSAKSVPPTNCFNEMRHRLSACMLAVQRVAALLAAVDCRDGTSLAFVDLRNQVAHGEGFETLSRLQIARSAAGSRSRRTASRTGDPPGIAVPPPRARRRCVIEPLLARMHPLRYRGRSPPIAPSVCRSSRRAPAAARGDIGLALGDPARAPVDQALGARSPAPRTPCAQPPLRWPDRRGAGPRLTFFGDRGRRSPARRPGRLRRRRRLPRSSTGTRGGVVVAGHLARRYPLGGPRQPVAAAHRLAAHLAVPLSVAGLHPSVFVTHDGIVLPAVASPARRSASIAPGALILGPPRSGATVPPCASPTAISTDPSSPPFPFRTSAPSLTPPTPPRCSRARSRSSASRSSDPRPGQRTAQHSPLTARRASPRRR